MPRESSSFEDRVTQYWETNSWYYCRETPGKNMQHKNWWCFFIGFISGSPGKNSFDLLNVGFIQILSTPHTQSLSFPLPLHHHSMRFCFFLVMWAMSVLFTRMYLFMSLFLLPNLRNKLSKALNQHILIPALEIKA